MAQNFFRGTADMVHLISFFFLLMKIKSTKNVNGLSLKAQVLYLLVFCTRYLDLIYSFETQTPYLITMKLLFISLTALTVVIMKFISPYKETYDADGDNFKVWLYLVLPVFLITLVFDYYVTPEDSIPHAFSLWLEAVAIVPQLIMLRKVGEVENLTAHYVACLAFYRFFYVLNWIYVYYNDNYLNYAIIPGVAQTLLYADFIYYYIRSLDKSRMYFKPVQKIEIHQIDSLINPRATKKTIEVAIDD